MRDAQVEALLVYLVEMAFPNRRAAWGRMTPSGRGVSAGGDREAFDWGPRTALPHGVTITPAIGAPGVLHGVGLDGPTERADLHLVPCEEGTWCVAVEQDEDDDSGPAGMGRGRDLEKQDILLHTIVHDLASPLSGIVGCLTAIEDGVDDPDQLSRLVSLALRQAHRQERLIRQILDVFQARDDDRPPEEASAPDIDEVARRLVENLEPSFALHDVRLRLEGERDGRDPRLVVGEETRLERVLANLLDNGLRHAPAGTEVVVQVEATERALEISVLDQGPGVPEAQVESLFKHLSQGENRGKVGLGLYFCRITIQRWGGHVGYDPRPEGGARFWIRLPRALD